MNIDNLHIILFVALVVILYMYLVSDCNTVEQFGNFVTAATNIFTAGAGKSAPTPAPYACDRVAPCSTNIINRICTNHSSKAKYKCLPTSIGSCKAIPGLFGCWTLQPN